MPEARRPVWHRLSRRDRISPAEGTRATIRNSSLIAHPICSSPPAGEYAEVPRRWPDLTEPGVPAEGGRDHAGCCRAIQVKLLQAAQAGMTGIRISPIRIAECLAWCAERGEDPGQARAEFAAHLAGSRPGALPAWPPGRNQPCRCGSGRKDKKCCAAPCVVRKLIAAARSGCTGPTTAC
jgi:hypothetical protein